MIVNARGSRTELTSLLKDLDAAADSVTEAHHAYIEVLVNEEQTQTAEKTYNEAIQSYDNTVERIGEYLEERKDQPQSVVSGPSKKSATQQSGTSAASMGTREAEIQLKLKQLKLEQLTQQLSQEKEEEALKQKHKLQAVQDEVEAARLETTLRKAAESGLAWERKDDFADEKITGKEDKLELNEPKVMCVGGDEKMAQPVREAPQDPGVTHDVGRSLPRLLGPSS